MSSADDTSSSAMLLSAKACISGVTLCGGGRLDRLPCGRLSLGLSDRQLQGGDIGIGDVSSGSEAPVRATGEQSLEQRHRPDVN
jgi:hypothetical protein